VYFPLTVDEAMLIEPTETESIETLDAFADALVAIAREAENDPEVVKTAPHTAPVRRLDEAGAARNPNLRWRPAVGDWTPVSRLSVVAGAGGRPDIAKPSQIRKAQTGSPLVDMLGDCLPIIPASRECAQQGGLTRHPLIPLTDLTGRMPAPRGTQETE
jgi:hypothetical protein